MITGRLLQVLWPAFLVGGMIEIFVFAMVDPEDVHLPGGVELSRTAIYSLAFFCFWTFAATLRSTTLE